MGNFDDIYLYVPMTQEVFVIAEGSGDNLDNEDYENGYVDYVYYDIHDAKASGLPEKDGGMLLTTEYVREKYSALSEAIEDVFNLAYSCRDMAYVVLQEDPREDEGELRKLLAA